MGQIVCLHLSNVLRHDLRFCCTAEQGQSKPALYNLLQPLQTTCKVSCFSISSLKILKLCFSSRNWKLWQTALPSLKCRQIRHSPLWGLAKRRSCASFESESGAKSSHGAKRLPYLELSHFSTSFSAIPKRIRKNAWCSMLQTRSPRVRFKIERFKDYIKVNSQYSLPKSSLYSSRSSVPGWWSSSLSQPQPASFARWPRVNAGINPSRSLGSHQQVIVITWKSNSRPAAASYWNRGWSWLILHLDDLLQIIHWVWKDLSHPAGINSQNKAASWLSSASKVLKFVGWNWNVPTSVICKQFNC